MDKISNKIFKVEDSTCEDCSQNYLGECRAFQLPQSEEERKARAKAVMKCCLRSSTL